MELNDEITEYLYDRFEGDFLQDLIVKLLEMEGELPEFEDETDLGKYISVIARYQYGNHSWTSKNRARLVQENMDALKDWISDESEDPALTLERDEEIEFKLSNMSALVQSAVTKHYVQGMTVQEIAKDEYEKEKTIYERLRVGRNTLKEITDGR